MAPVFSVICILLLNVNVEQKEKGLEMHVSHRYCREAVVCNGSHCSSFLLSSPEHKI